MWLWWKTVTGDKAPGITLVKVYILYIAYLHRCVYSLYIYTQCTRLRSLVLLFDCTALLIVSCFIDTAGVQL